LYQLGDECVRLAAQSSILAETTSAVHGASLSAVIGIEITAEAQRKSTELIAKQELLQRGLFT
jgi:hypothetical protein